MMNKEEQRIIRLAKCLCESEPLDQIFESDDSENVDWELFIKLIMEQCISPLCYLPLSRHAPKEYAGKLQASYALHHIKTLNDVRIANDITKLLSRNGINATVSKGFPLSHYIYGNCYARRYSDIDIFVDKKHLPYAYRLLLENNYICHDFDAVPDGIYVDYDRVWDKDMELHFGIPYDKKSFVGKMCEIEIKKSDRTAAFGIDLIDFINRSAKKCEEMAGYEIPTLDETFTILYLMTNTHKNYFQIWGYLHQQPFRDLIDIYCMIRRHPHINIEYLKDTADRLHMSDRICEVLALVAEVFDGCDQYSIFREFGVKNFTFNEDKILNILRPEQRIKAYFRELYKKTDERNIIYINGDDREIRQFWAGVPVKTPDIKVFISRKDEYLHFRFDNILRCVEQTIRILFWSHRDEENEWIKKPVIINFAHDSLSLRNSEVKGVKVSEQEISEDSLTVFVDVPICNITENREVYLEVYADWPKTNSAENSRAHLGSDDEPIKIVF